MAAEVDFLLTCSHICIHTLIQQQTECICMHINMYAYTHTHTQHGKGETQSQSRYMCLREGDSQARSPDLVGFSLDRMRSHFCPAGDKPHPGFPVWLQDQKGFRSYHSFGWVPSSESLGPLIPEAFLLQIQRRTTSDGTELSFQTLKRLRQEDGKFQVLE